MKELKSDLSDAKVGDWVLDLHEGWVKVVRHDGPAYPAILANNRIYHNNGRDAFDDKYPICFAADQVPPELLVLYGPPPCEFKRGDRVVAWDGSDSIKRIRVFKEHTPGRTFPYKILGGEMYKHCKKWEGEDGE